ncbi:MAG: glycosyltransferase family 1 protein [Solirubrobacteraceae bacterium]
MPQPVASPAGAGSPASRPVRLGYSLLTVRPGQIGGAETYVRDLLDALVPGGSTDPVRILANAEVAERYAGRGAEIRFVAGMDPHGAKVGRAARLAAAYLTPGRILGDATDGLDLVHFPVAVAIPRPRIPHVVTLHDVAHHAVPEFFSRGERAYRAVAYDRSARRADLVITISEHARGQIVDHLGIDPAKVVAIHHGIDLARFTPEATGDDTVLAGLDLPERFAYYPANMWPHKNHLRLVEAFAQVEDRSLHLVLTGQTYGRDAELAAAVRAAGLTGRVHHLGYVPAAAVPALHRRALAMVFPSLFEGFGFPPLEAMACGCPVAASHAGSLAETLGDAAVLFDPLDPASIAAAVDRLATDEALRTRLTREARPHAERFTWQASAEAHVRAYRAVLARA